MAETEKLPLHHPWLVAVWPGMGHVALNAGYYLLTKLGMHTIAEFEARELFDIDHVEVKEGIIQAGRRPRNRFFVWNDPDRKHDIVVFLGEAQPPIGKYSFCQKLVEFARELGVERVFTFAAMATQMHPQQRARIFAAATDREGLEELKRLELEVLEDGNIGGLNGVLLGAVAESGLPGACLLCGETVAEAEIAGQRCEGGRVRTVADDRGADRPAATDRLEGTEQHVDPFELAQLADRGVTIELTEAAAKWIGELQPDSATLANEMAASIK